LEADLDKIRRQGKLYPKLFFGLLLESRVLVAQASMRTRVRADERRRQVKKFLVMIMVVGLVLAIAVAVLGDDKNQSAQQPADPVQTAPNTVTAGTTYVQPKWAPVLTLTPELEYALSTSHEGLKVEPAPGGGQMVDLQGRFQHLSVLAVDAEGNLVTQCVTPGHDHAQSQSDNHSKDAKPGGEE
jgi:hypothetical protein